MQKVAGEYTGLIAASDDSVFHVRTGGEGGEVLHRSSYAGTVEAEYQHLEGYALCSPVLAPGGLLFCVIHEYDDYERDEIIALDAQTLQLRHRFGLGLLNEAYEMAVGGRPPLTHD